MDMRPSPHQQALADRAYKLAVESFAPRAAESDREAVFPTEDYADLRASGLLALCVPQQNGGLGADFETYCLVAEQLARGNASTALTYNMHSLTMLMMGPLVKDLEMLPDVRERHEELSARRYREVVEQGVFYAQPHSEQVESGSADQLEVGGRRFGTRAERVDGGYLVNGRKFFVSSAGAADYYATPALLVADGPWEARTLYLAIPRDASGVELSGEWDPTGDARHRESGHGAERCLGAGRSGDPAAGRLWPAIPAPAAHVSRVRRHFFGIDAGGLRLHYRLSHRSGRGRTGHPGGSSGGWTCRGRDAVHPGSNAGAILPRAISEERLDPPVECIQRARAAHVQVQRAVVHLTGEAIRVCGGRAFLKRHPLERFYRDARAMAVMRPWTQDIATQQTWETALATPRSDTPIDPPYASQS